MKNYFCFYTAGLAGTWLTWFINQHASFPQYKMSDNTTDNVVTDLTCLGSTWCYMADDEDGCSDDALTFDQYLSDVTVKYSQNNSATKRCIKVLPDHDLSDLDSTSDLFTEVMNKIDYIIMPTLLPDSPMSHLIERRVAFMWGDADQRHQEMIEIYADVTNGVYDTKFNKPIHYLQIDKLLNGNEAEYNALLDIIEESPIDNWAQIAADYRINFIEKDYGKIK